MPEVLEFEEIKTIKSQKVKPKWDSWVIDVPSEIIEAQELADDAMIVLTIKNGIVEAEILPELSDDLKAISDKILKKRGNLYNRLEKIGD